MKKKLLGLTASALLLVGCTSNEVFEDISVNLKDIGFETLNDHLTKAANDQNAHYGVFAKATSNAAEFYKFNNREVTPGAAGDTYSPKELWPSYALDFFAYAPYNATAPISFIDGTFSFAVPADGQTDLSFAKTTDQTKGSVQLQFNHMLSKVQLGSVALAQNLIDAGYTLDATAANQIKIQVEKNQGKNNLYTQGDWTELAGTGAMYENNKSYYILPQSISTNQTVKIQLNGLRILKGGSVYKENISVKFSWVPKSAIKNTKPTAGADGVFMKGRCYTINFTLGSDATEPDPTDPKDPEKPGEPIFDNYIGFTSSVVDWDCESMTIGLGIPKPVIDIPVVEFPEVTFMMGSPEDEADRQQGDVEIQHEVTLSPFKIGKYEITNAQYCEFLNKSGIGQDGKWGAGNYPNQMLIRDANTTLYKWGCTWSGTNWVPNAGYENHPVINVTWFGAAEFSRWVGGRLPTEAEWEYACRAGTSTAYSTGTNITRVQANFNDMTPFINTQKTGSYAANPFGLYEMHGNVSEWCADWFGMDYYLKSPDKNPTGPATGNLRIARGGGFDRSPNWVRSAARYYWQPQYAYYALGFRVVFSL